MALLLLTPSMPNRLKALNRDRAAKPLLPTSIGRQLALHPACRHSPTSPSCLASFLSKASSRRSSQGTGSSNRTTSLVDSDKRTASGLKLVVTMWLGLLLQVNQQLPVLSLDIKKKRPTVHKHMRKGVSINIPQPYATISQHWCTGRADTRGLINKRGVPQNGAENVHTPLPTQRL